MRNSFYVKYEYATRDLIILLLRLGIKSSSGDMLYVSISGRGVIPEFLRRMER